MRTFAPLAERDLPVPGELLDALVDTLGPPGPWVLIGATARDLMDCQDIVDRTIEWYELDVIGDSLDNWLALDSADAFFSWLDAAPHAASALGLLTRFARRIGLQKTGIGARHFLSAGESHA